MTQAPGWIPACAGMLALFVLLITSAHAADYTYAPEGCDFRMTFPEEPLSETRCNPEKPEQCYKAITFNRVFALDSSVRVNATCNPAEENMLERYSGEVMEFTLESMARSAVTDYQTSFADHGDAKEAILLGAHKMPDGTEKIYMAQLWIGKTSLMTIEAEVTGMESPDTDALFISIMKSVRLAAWDENGPAAKKEPLETKGKKSEDPAAEKKKE